MSDNLTGLANASERQLNGNFEKQEFQELWRRINRKAIYGVAFDTSELVRKCVQALNAKLNVSSMQFHVVVGEQTDQASVEALQRGGGFRVRESVTQTERVTVHSAVTYDLLGKLSEITMLTRSTIAAIMRGTPAAVFAQYRLNPEDFIQKTGRLINEQKAAVIVEHLAYNPTGDTFDVDIFTQKKQDQDFSQAFRAERHIVDYVFTDSKGERTFVEALDTAQEVVVYAKLPRGFFIPTPMGNYNPDWAIAFHDGTVKHVYFVAETKGDLSTLELRAVEEGKIACARRFFAAIASDRVKYDVVDSFGKLMEVVQQ